ATRIPAREELTHCSPSAMRYSGMTISQTAKARMAPLLAIAGRSAPRFQARGSITAAPSAARLQATQSGEKSSSASLTKKYGMPQTTHRARNTIHPRQLNGASRQESLRHFARVDETEIDLHRAAEDLGAEVIAEGDLRVAPAKLDGFGHVR